MSLPFLWIIALHFKVVKFETDVMSPLQDFRLPPRSTWRTSHTPVRCVRNFENITATQDSSHTPQEECTNQFVCMINFNNTAITLLLRYYVTLTLSLKLG